MTADIKQNLKRAIYDLSCYEFIEGKVNLKAYPIESQKRILKDIKRARAYILRYLKLFNDLSQSQQGDFMNEERKDFLFKIGVLKWVTKKLRV